VCTDYKRIKKPHYTRRHSVKRRTGSVAGTLALEQLPRLRLGEAGPVRANEGEVLKMTSLPTRKSKRVLLTRRRWGPPERSPPKRRSLDGVPFRVRGEPEIASTR
jgi:hypothetical protein